ncbi:hypothetical protein QJN73_25570, partial [Escherichia coli]
IPSTEAEWFFDSWYAKSAAIVYKESRKEEYLNDSVQFMNRSFAPIIFSPVIWANDLFINCTESFKYSSFLDSL